MAHIKNFNDYENLIYLNTNLTKEEARTIGRYYWNKGLEALEAIKNIRTAPRFELIEKKQGELTELEADSFEGFWDAVQNCITLDRTTQKDIWVACYKHGILERIVKPTKEDEGVALHFEAIDL